LLRKSASLNELQSHGKSQSQSHVDSLMLYRDNSYTIHDMVVYLKTHPTVVRYLRLILHKGVVVVGVYLKTVTVTVSGSAENFGRKQHASWTATITACLPCTVCIQETP
jgi:hypothetical protein